MSDGRNNGADGKKGILHEPAFVIAFITALFYICIFGYFSGNSARLEIPPSIRDISFLSLLSNGFTIAQLITIFLIMVFPIYLIYRYPNKTTYGIILLPYIIIFTLIQIYSSQKVDGIYIKWISGDLFELFKYSFALYLAIFFDMFLYRYLISYEMKNKIAEWIKGIEKNITPHHFYYILIMITLVCIIFSPFIGDHSAQQSEPNIGDFKINITPKDQNLSKLDGWFYFISHSNGNFIIKENNSTHIIYHIVPDSEVKMATLQKKRNDVKD